MGQLPALPYTLSLPILTPLFVATASPNSLSQHPVWQSLYRGSLVHRGPAWLCSHGRHTFHQQGCPGTVSALGWTVLILQAFRAVQCPVCAGTGTRLNCGSGGAGQKRRRIGRAAHRCHKQRTVRGPRGRSRDRTFCKPSWPSDFTLQPVGLTCGEHFLYEKGSGQYWLLGHQDRFIMNSIALKLAKKLV